MSYTTDDVVSLTAKLVELDLTPGEGAALAALVGAAGSAEVSGFSRFDLASSIGSILEPLRDHRRYIGETEKNLAVFEPNDEP